MTAPFMKSLYNGTLILEDAAQEAFLQYQDATGTVQQLLMMLDPFSSGCFDQANLVAAWQRFSQTSSSGNPVTVKGFVLVSPNGNQPILHVV
jgi:hypothetical protein